jgi:hypothetical protein
MIFHGKIATDPLFMKLTDVRFAEYAATAAEKSKRSESGSSAMQAFLTTAARKEA